MYRMWATAIAAVLVVTGSAGWAAAQDQDKDSLEVIRKAIKAAGGQDVLEKYKASRSKSKGKIHIGGNDLEFTADELVQMPDKIRSDIQINANGQDLMVIQGFDGKKGWVKVGDQTMDLDDKQVAEMKAVLHASRIGGLVALLKDKEFKLSPLAEAKVSDRPAVGVQVKYKGERDVKLYFDKANGLLVKSASKALDQMSGEEVNQEKILSGYKAVQGRQVPHKVTVNRDGEPYLEMEISEVRLVESHDASKFTKPE